MNVFFVVKTYQLFAKLSAGCYSMLFSIIFLKQISKIVAFLILGLGVGRNINDYRISYNHSKYDLKKLAY